MNPTDEQTFALDCFSTEENLVVEAGAGTGKTSTLILMAEDTTRKGQYIAFNKAIVTDAERRMPRNVKAKTAHGLAYGRVGFKYKARLNSPRMKSQDIANILGIKSLRVDGKDMAAGFLASAVMKAITNFCNSADEEPGTKHFSYIDGIDEPFSDGKRSYANNDYVRSELAPFLAVAWADINGLEGRLPFKHEHYLKIWQLSGPRIAADFILFDECQDANPVMLAIVEAQTHAQKVYVGDSQQAIYEFTGAINALGKLADSGATTAFLTQSWRFGQEIADKANEVLGMLDAPLRLIGHPGMDSTVGFVPAPKAFLARTNGGAIEQLFAEMDRGGNPHLVGGGSDIISFAYGADKLMKGERTDNPELACFESWAEVKDYVANDQQGDDLKLLVSVMDRFGPIAIVSALQGQAKEDKASLVVSTAHKAKGREWDTVALAGDFPDPEKREITEQELKLLYVAATRARDTLDIGAVAILSPQPPANIDPNTGEIVAVPEPTEEKPDA